MQREISSLSWWYVMTTQAWRSKRAEVKGEGANLLKTPNTLQTDREHRRARWQHYQLWTPDHVSRWIVSRVVSTEPWDDTRHIRWWKCSHVLSVQDRAHCLSTQRHKNTIGGGWRWNMMVFNSIGLWQKFASSNLLSTGTLLCKCWCKHGSLWQRVIRYCHCYVN